MKTIKILLIIPAYNEEKCILNTVGVIDKYNKDNKGNQFDYIVINDGSKDNTGKILDDNNITHIDLIQNLGIGGAVQTGYKYALENNYDIAVQFDGDGQHDVNCVKDIIKPIINNDANMVIGSRFIKKDKSNFNSTFTRRLGINIISFFIKLFTFKKVCDPTSGFRASDKSVIRLFANSYPTEYPEPVSEVTLLKNKYTVSEIPVKMHERQGGKSSIHAWKTVYYMVNVTIAMFIERIKK